MFILYSLRGSIYPLASFPYWSRVNTAALAGCTFLNMKGLLQMFHKATSEQLPRTGGQRDWLQALAEAVESQLHTTTQSC